MSNFWKNKKVLITGHSGFKGSWLSLWLSELGAELYGFALPPETNPSLFSQLGLDQRMKSKLGDIRDAEALRCYIQEIQVDFVFHMAAQSLVLRGYKQAQHTWATNVLGTVNVLEAIRDLERSVTIIVVTSDKVYHNKEWEYGYRETDRLGGVDPYSASKAATELVVDSYRPLLAQSSKGIDCHKRLASVRAGNVIGGGDWAENRLLPDIVRALEASQSVETRNPLAVRPWQHVLEPLYGYMLVAEILSNDPSLAGPFNFGPMQQSNKTVRTVIETCLSHWSGHYHVNNDGNAPHEAGCLKLSIDKAASVLGWQPRWSFEETIYKTIDWYKSVHEGGDPLTVTLEQIRDFTEV